MKLKSQLKDLFYFKLFNALPTKFALSAYGIWLKKCPADATYRFCVTGIYGHYLSDLLRHGHYSAFLDIGSNYGLYSLVAAQNPNIEHVFSFEPNPRIYTHLQDNIVRNAASRVTAFPVGLGDAAANLVLSVADIHSGGGTLRDVGPPDDTRQQIKVRIETSDFIDRSIKVSQPGPIFCKIDVEGHEPQVISGLQRSRLWPFISDIFLEANDNHYDVSKLIADLKKDGFEIIFRTGLPDDKHFDLHFRRPFIAS